jgi:hypothetical protein
MRFSLDSALLFLAFAHALAAPVSANEDEPNPHVLRRASRGFRRSALRHSAGLARDLRVALRGLGTADTAHHAAVLARSNLAKKPYCVSNGKRQSNSSAGSDTHHTVSPASNPTASRSTTTSPTSSPGQSNFRLAQSYVSNRLIWSPPARVKFADADHLGDPLLFHFRSLVNLFSRVGTSSPAATRPMGWFNLSISRPRCVWSCVWSLVCILMTCALSFHRRPAI